MSIPSTAGRLGLTAAAAAEAAGRAAAKAAQDHGAGEQHISGIFHLLTIVLRLSPVFFSTMFCVCPLLVLNMLFIVPCCCCVVFLSPVAFKLKGIGFTISTLRLLCSLQRVPWVQLLEIFLICSRGFKQVEGMAQCSHRFCGLS